MKKVLIYLSFSILILVIIIGSIHVMKLQDLQKNTEKQALFTLKQSSVSEIATQNGTTGERIAYRDAEDIREIIKILNNFKYTNTKEVPPSDGWSYRIIITMTKDEKIDLFLLDESDVYMDNTRYISAKKDYFSPLIHSWMPK